MLLDLLDRHPRRGELFLRAHVDPVEAGPLDGRGRDPNMDLGRAGLEHELHDLLRGRRSDDRVVDEDDPFPAYVRLQRREFHPDATLAHVLIGRDEGAVDVPALHHAFAIGNTAMLRVAQRGRDPAVGHGDHDISFHRMLDRELMPHPLSCGVEQRVVHLAVGAREVDELEHAHRSAGRRRALSEPHALRVDDDHLSGFHLVLHDAIEGREGAALASHEITAILESSGDQRANPQGIAETENHGRREYRAGIGALDPAHRRGDGVLRSEVHIAH